MHGGDWEVGQITVWDVNCLLDGISQIVESGAEDDPHKRFTECGYFVLDFLGG
jgi:hypothetical protein